MSRAQPTDVPPDNVRNGSGLVTNLGIERTEAQHDRCLSSNPHNVAPPALADGPETLAPLEARGAVELDRGRVRVMPDARLLLRVVCAAFDRRLSPAVQRHALAI